MFDRNVIYQTIEREHTLQSSDTWKLLIHVLTDLHLLTKKIDHLMSTTAEVVAFIADLKTEVTTIGTKVDALESAINNAPADSIPAAVTDALTDLKTSLDGLSTKADNAPAPPPTTEPTV